ncbi:MAG TPA: hypothetical protein VFC79_08315 [Tissierellaceae bacterium]|nr:hypothetical protein [Tissierellaceae bacterium]
MEQHSLNQVIEAVSEYQSHSFLDANYLEILEFHCLDTGIESYDEVVEDFDYYF